MDDLEKYQMDNVRTASVVSIGDSASLDSPLASHFCLTPVALPDEEWPSSNSGEPLWFVCQLNLTDAPAVPELLKDIALITFFVGDNPGDVGLENGEGWLLRAYHSTDGLVPMDVPEGGICGEIGLACSWEEREDYPTADDPDQIVPEGFDPLDDEMEMIEATKIGGWAALIQSEPWWECREHPATPKYCMQIGSEDKVDLMWGDCGTLYIGRGTAPGHQEEWFMEWQCD